MHAMYADSDEIHHIPNDSETQTTKCNKTKMWISQIAIHEMLQ